MAYRMARTAYLPCLSKMASLTQSCISRDVSLHASLGPVVRGNCYASNHHHWARFAPPSQLCCSRYSSSHVTLDPLYCTALLPIQTNVGSFGTRWISTAHTDNFAFKSKKGKLYTEEDDDEKKLSLLQKFRLMYRQYWYVLLPVHVATSIVWYGSFFIAAKSGVDIVPMLQTFGVTSEKLLSHLQDSNAGYYAIAYAMYKVATPARYTVTLGCTTFSINYLKNRGYIKPVPTKKQLREMYEDKREEMKGKRDEMRELFEERRDEFRERFEERRDEMKGILEERRDELRERFASKDMMDRIEGKKEEIYEKIDKFGGRKELQDNLEQKTKAFKSKLEETKDIMNKFSNQSDFSKIGKK